jgi:hypothetical protein
VLNRHAACYDLVVGSIGDPNNFVTLNRSFFMKHSILNVLAAGVAAMLVTACGGAAGSGATSGAARNVTGQLSTQAQASAAAPMLRNLTSGNCDLDGDFVIRAIPSTGAVVDARPDADGNFSFDLAKDVVYMVAFFQNGVSCAILVNTHTGAPEMVGIDNEDFSFGSITIDENGNFVPTNDAEDLMDSDDDGTVDSDDTDFDGDGTLDDSELDTDDDGVADEYDCDDDDDGSFDSEDSDDDGDGIEDSQDDGSDSSDDGTDSEDSGDDSSDASSNATLALHAH